VVTRTALGDGLTSREISAAVAADRAHAGSSLYALDEAALAASLPAVRAGQVWVVDGPAYFNRPGPRVVRGVEVLAHVLHGIGTVAPAEAVSVVPPL
jgi:hypothetical protein